jgi:lysophospholipase
MSTNLSATLRLFPGIAAATVSAFFMPPIRGVVLETYGAGNAPQRADLMLALKEACDRGVVVVAITQCTKGSVSDAYETGRTLLQAGIVSGGDMTPEVCCGRRHNPSTHIAMFLAVCAHQTELSAIQTGAFSKRGP